MEISPAYGNAGIGVANYAGMKKNSPKHQQKRTVTLAELVATVDEFAHNDRLSAIIVADLINTRRVHLEGVFRGRRVIVR